MSKEKTGSDPKFIRFSKVQSAFLKKIIASDKETRVEQNEEFFEEFNEAVGMIYEELGIAEKALKAPDGTYKLRQDLSGVDIISVKKDKSGKDK